MRTKFPGYYRPTDDEFKEMWEKGLFVFDTNVLLDFYRYSNETVQELFKIMNVIQDRIWIPYQVSKEYHKNLTSIVAEQVRKYDQSLKTLSSFKKQIEEKRNHPFIEDDLNDEVDKFCEKFDSVLNDKKNEIKDFIVSNPIKEQIADLFISKIGDEFSLEELKAIFKDGEERYRDKIPPGYMDDKKKPFPDKYGDLIIWKEILKKNFEIEQPIIFITRDTKEDWFLNEMGLTISPRPELIAEFIKSKPSLFYCYTTSSFLKYANEYLEADIDRKSIVEIEEVMRGIEKLNDTNHSIEDNDIGFVSLDEINDLEQLDSFDDFINDEDDENNDEDIKE